MASVGQTRTSGGWVQVWKQKRDGKFGWVNVRRITRDQNKGTDPKSTIGSPGPTGTRPSRVAPPTGGAPIPTAGGASGSGGGATTPSATSVRDRALAALDPKRPTYAGRYTDITGRTGFGFGRQGGGLASFEEAFGTADTENAPGAGLVLRDALGRPIDMSVLGTDVFAPGARENIANTSLGDLILRSRRAAAEAAESSAARGLAGGVAGAIRTATETASSAGLADLIRGFTSEVGGLQGEILADYLDAFKDISESDTSEFAPAPTPPTSETNGAGGGGASGAGGAGGAGAGGGGGGGGVIRFDGYNVRFAAGEKPPTQIEQRSLDNKLSGIKNWRNIKTNPPRRQSPAFTWRGKRYVANGTKNKAGRWVYTLEPAGK